MELRGGFSVSRRSRNFSRSARGPSTSMKDALGGIVDPAGQPEFRGQPEDERAEADALNGAAHAGLESRSIRRHGLHILLLQSASARASGRHISCPSLYLFCRGAAIEFEGEQAAGRSASKGRQGPRGRRRNWVHSRSFRRFGPLGRQLLASRCRVCSTLPSASMSSICSGIWPAAWVEQLRHGS